MKLLNRLIVFTLVKMTLLALFSLVLLFSFFALVDQLNAVGRGNYGVWQAMGYVFLTVPRLSLELFPIATAIGSMTAFATLAKHSELVILRTYGMSLIECAQSLIIGTLILVALSLFVGEGIAPQSERQAKNLRAVHLSKQISPPTAIGFWSRSARQFVNIRTLRPDNSIEGIYLYDFDASHRLKTSTFAERGRYHHDHWVVEGISRSAITDERVTVTEVDSARWDNLPAPGVIKMALLKPQSLSFADLGRYIHYLDASAQNSTMYELALWSKIARYLSIIVMGLVALPVIAMPVRTTAVGRRVFLGCLIGVVFHIINQIAGEMSIVYAVNPAVGSLLPTVLALAFVIAVIWRQQRLPVR